MKRKKHTPAQIVEKLRRADILLGQKSSIAEVVTALEVSEQTYYRWRRQYGGAGRTEVRRLRDLEKENARLKLIVADQALDLAMAKDVIEGQA